MAFVGRRMPGRSIIVVDARPVGIRRVGVAQVNVVHRVNDAAHRPRMGHAIQVS